jgi:hypothetical protein
MFLSLQVGFDLKAKLVSLRERDVVVAGLIEDPTVAASLLSNCLSTAQAGSAEMKQLFALSVPSTVRSNGGWQCRVGLRSFGGINASKIQEPSCSSLPMHSSYYCSNPH